MANNRNISYTVSSRSISKNSSIIKYLNDYFPYIKIDQVESFYGFVDQFSPLYGGRKYEIVDIMHEKHVNEMREHNVGVSLTLTNYYFNEELYEKTIPLLEKYHNELNSIVCVNDNLAKRIKKDFPLYSLKASLIKNINTYEKVVEAFKVYDYVVIPMDKNDDFDFLKSLPNKEKVILFTNANCAYNCDNKICYRAISKSMANIGSSKLGCSKTIIERENLGHTFFDVNKFISLGFKHFKLVPDPKIKKYSREPKNRYGKEKLVFYVFSMPKTGRTWLRFILANYFNLIYNLKLKVDMNSMFHIIPNDGLSPEKGKGAYKFMDDKRFPLIIMSHKNLKNIVPNRKNVIVLIRLVYDVMVSDYFQHKYYLKRFEGSIKEFIRLPMGPLVQYCNFMNTLEKKENQILFMTYENMQKNIEVSILSLFDYLQIPIDYKALEKSIQVAKFDNMKVVEEEFGFFHKGQEKSNPNANRVREGKMNNYKKYLDDEDIKYIENFCEKNLSNASKSILEKFNISHKLLKD